MSFNFMATATWEAPKLYGTYVQVCAVGVNSGEKIQNDQKCLLPLVKSREQKQGVGSKSGALSVRPAHNTSRGVGKTLKPPPAQP